MDQVREFWDTQAKEFGASDLATAPDHHYRTLEVREIVKQLQAEMKPGARALDIGCGNGYSTLIFGERFPTCEFVGIDYSAPMIEHATEAARDRRNVIFRQGNVLSLTDLKDEIGSFEVVISERCIINLRDWQEQERAILQMRAMLKPNGVILLVENTQEGLANLNQVRAQFGLHEIKTRWHNYYVPQKRLEDWLIPYFRLEARENIGNLYYLMSRVLYAKLAADEGQEPQYEHPINKIASQLPTLGDYNFSPNFLYALRRIEPSVEEAEAEAEMSGQMADQILADIDRMRGNK